MILVELKEVVALTVATKQLSIHTSGEGEIRDITGEVADALMETGLKHGIVTVFVPGARSNLWY